MHYNVLSANSVALAGELLPGGSPLAKDLEFWREKLKDIAVLELF